MLDPELVNWSVTLVDEIADHCNLLLDLDLEAIGSHKIQFKPTRFEYRDFSEANIEKFKTKIGETNFEGVLRKTEVNEATNVFYEQYYNAFNECFPIKIKI